MYNIRSLFSCMVCDSSWGALRHNKMINCGRIKRFQQKKQTIEIKEKKNQMTTYFIDRDIGCNCVFVDSCVAVCCSLPLLYSVDYFDCCQRIMWLMTFCVQYSSPSTRPEQQRRKEASQHWQTNLNGSYLSLIMDREMFTIWCPEPHKHSSPHTAN